MKYNTSTSVFILKSSSSVIQTICPYVGGSAVYKARSLNFYLQPGAMYDDMKACNAVGVYKQGNSNNENDINTISLISRENEILSHLKPNEETMKLKINDFVLYPNPTGDIVNIRYNTNENCRFELFDIAGRKLKVVLFVGGYSTATISMKDFLSGVYSYKFFVGNNLNKSGKIIKK